MRYTMDINARACELLINADGIIESFFSSKECSMEITSFAYQNWRFDMESLPNDLIQRGIAEANPSEPHGLKLPIEDYPYANDGLLIWSAIEKLVKDYDLVSILTTLIWIASAKHAALNFRQYNYGGYVPVRPSYMRRLVPNEHDPEYETFLADPEGYFLSSLPSLREMTFLMSLIGILSIHSSDEEYFGDRKDLSTWLEDPEIIEAFYKFSMDIVDAFRVWASCRGWFKALWALTMEMSVRDTLELVRDTSNLLVHLSCHRTLFLSLPWTWSYGQMSS
ncbi:hypothetical protein PTKIN_Ptkin07bG0266500 [Pterospermum kingtungense]